MTVYVDEMRNVLYASYTRPAKWRHPTSCHMLAATPDELERMARKLRLRRDWKHGDHYDLTANKRRLAVKAGAVEVPSRELVAVRKRLMREAAEAAGGEA